MRHLVPFALLSATILAVTQSAPAVSETLSFSFSGTRWGQLGADPESGTGTPFSGSFSYDADQPSQWDTFDNINTAASIHDYQGDHALILRDAYYSPVAAGTGFYMDFVSTSTKSDGSPAEYFELAHLIVLGGGDQIDETHLPRSFVVDANYQASVPQEGPISNISGGGADSGGTHLPTSPVLASNEFKNQKETAHAVQIVTSNLARAMDVIATVADGPEALAKNVAFSIIDSALEGFKSDVKQYVKTAETAIKLVKGNALSLGATLLSYASESIAEKAGEIYNDPPDTNFKSVYIPSKEQEDIAGSLSGLNDAWLWSKTFNDMNTYGDDLAALLHAAERYDGAGNAGDTESQSNQLSALRMFSILAGRDKGELVIDLGRLSHDVDLSGADPALAKYLMIEAFDLGSSAASSDLPAWELTSVQEAAITGQCSAGFSRAVVRLLDSAGIDDKASDAPICHGSADASHTMPSNGPGFTLEHDFVSPDGAVPEPTSWLLMIVGFGLLGLRARQKIAVQRSATR